MKKSKFLMGIMKGQNTKKKQVAASNRKHTKKHKYATNKIPSKY